MAVTRWVFTDPADSSTYTVAMNPDEVDSPNFERNIGFQATAAADGGVLVYEGRRPPSEFQFSGTILAQAHYEALKLWSEKHNPIGLTDDLGRGFTIVIKSWQPKRVRSAQYPWKHTFTCQATVLAEA